MTIPKNVLMMNSQLDDNHHPLCKHVSEQGEHDDDANHDDDIVMTLRFTAPTTTIRPQSHLQKHLQAQMVYAED